MQQFTCIVCPKGCMIVADDDGITGAGCERGNRYVQEEMKNPTRMLTSTVRLENSDLPRLPVKTSKPIPKSMIRRAAALLNDVTAVAPVATGDVLLKDVLGTEADLVATKSVNVKCDGKALI